MPAGGWALVGVTVGDVSSSATAIGTGGVAVDVDGCGPDGCTLRGEGGECAAGEAVTILVSSSSGIDSSSCMSGDSLGFIEAVVCFFKFVSTGSMFVTIASWLLCLQLLLKVAHSGLRWNSCC